MKKCSENMGRCSMLFAGALACVLISGTSARLAFASEMDSKTEVSAKQSYVYATYLKDDPIAIKSVDGAVTLTGSVADGAHRSLAVDTVANLPGVKSVDDQLTLKGDLPAENTDGWVGMKVKTALLFHHNVNAFKTEVDVKDGVVTLKGEAVSQAQKDLAGEYAKDVSGVKDVKNEMTLSMPPQSGIQLLRENIDDSSIFALVKVALLSHHSTSAVNTKVSVSAGVVTISGEARNEAEKELVGKLSRDVTGVKSVVNNMTVMK